MCLKVTPHTLRLTARLRRRKRPIEGWKVLNDNHQSAMRLHRYYKGNNCEFDPVHPVSVRRAVKQFGHEYIADGALHLFATLRGARSYMASWGDTNCRVVRCTFYPCDLIAVGIFQHRRNYAVKNLHISHEDWEGA